MSITSPPRSRPETPPLDRRSLLHPCAAVLLLLATALVPALEGRADLRAVTVIVLLLAAGAWLLGSQRTMINRLRSASPPRAARGSVELILHLSPVALLTLAFPIAVARMGDAQVGGVALPTILLASSLTVPWLSMAVCLPLYRAIGPLMSAGDVLGVRSRLCAVWPATFLQSLPVVALFTFVLQAVMGWSASAIATYASLCVLHVAFAQSLVVANVERHRLLWASAWVAYAVALLIAPLAWFLPPVVAMLTQVFYLRRQLSQLRRFSRLEHRDVGKDLMRGLLLGSVLWSHLFVLFLAAGGQFAVVTIFIAVLPAVLAYNYYFVRLAPTFDDGVAQLRSAMEREPHYALAEHSTRLATTVLSTVNRTGFIGAGLAFVITATIAGFTGLSVTLVAVVSLASWLFLMTTVACYKLDYVGHVAEAQLFSAAHLLGVLAVFVIFPAGVTAYAWLIVVELIVLAGALHRCLMHWRDSEYALFWRHATAW